MRSRTLCRVAVAAWTLAGCAGAQEPQPDIAARPSPAELEALYLARTDSARTRFSQADVRFVTGMIGHHAQAIDVALLAPERGTSPALATLAARIVAAQRDEIAWMETWLRDRGQPVPESDSGSGHEGHLPGMLTSAQLQELDRARGPEFDRLFLTCMIQHHRGAISMVTELLATDGAVQHPATFKLASDIHADQTAEIARMERLLDTMPSGATR